MKKKQYFLFVLSHIFILSTCITQALSADMRVRGNNIIIRNSTLDKSSNGVDVINITNPNKAGISHNKFDAFDINGKVIINNSMESGISQIGGQVSRNPNLSNNAQLIVNEILSGSASKINGTIEIFGKKADLILANENGFSLNGANFINTNGLTLTSGIFNGKNINVLSNAPININGNVNVDGNYFNIISKSMQLNGNIKANKINLLAGLNEVDLNDIANPIVTHHKDSAKKLDYAIDANALGSMYANTISIISTDSGVGVRHNGIIKSANDILIKSQGNVETYALDTKNLNINGDNIKAISIAANDITLKASNNVENLGRIKAHNNLAINANHITNNGILESAKNINLTAHTIDNNIQILANGDIDIKARILNNNSKVFANNLFYTPQDTTINGNGGVGYGDSAFKTWQAYLNLTPIQYNNNVSISQAIIKSNGNIKINQFDDTKSFLDYKNNSSINNYGGLIEAQTTNINGNISNLTQNVNKKVVDVLRDVKINGEITTKEYLGSWNTNGSSYGASNLLEALELISQNWIKDHQRESIWNAIKDSANKNEYIKQYLSALLGSNYAAQRFIPSKDKWNYNATITFAPDKVAIIKSRQNTHISGNNVINKNPIDNTKDNNSGILIDNKNADSSQSVIVAGNEIEIYANNLVNSLGKIEAKDKISLDIKNKFSHTSSSILSDDISIKAQEIALQTLLGVDENGKTDSTKQSQIKGNNINITANDNINIQNSDIVGTGKDSTINLGAKNINIANDYSLQSIFTQKNDNTSNHTYMAESSGILSSNINADNINLNAKNDINIQASQIKSRTMTNLQANNIDIHNAQSTFEEQVNSHKVGDTLQTSTSYLKQSLSNGSLISSQGDIHINATNKINIKDSAINADNLIISANKINIQDGKNETKSIEKGESLGFGGYQNHSTEISNSLSSASLLSANNLTLNAKTINIEGGNLKANDNLNLNAQEINLKSGKNTSTSTTSKIGIGFTMNAQSGIAGYGANANYSNHNFATNIFDENYSSYSKFAKSPKTIISDSLAKAEVGLAIYGSSENTKETTWKNSLLEAKNINITANDSIDIGGANFVAVQDINITAGKVESTKYTDTKKIEKQSWQIYAKQSLDTQSNLAQSTNQLANNIHNVNDNKNLNAGIIATQAVSAVTNSLFGDMIAENSTQSFGFNYSNSSSTSKSQNITNINAGGNLNIKSTKGDINLNGVNGRAENINLDSKANINIKSAESVESSKSNSLGMEGRTKQAIGVNIVNGSKTTFGTGGGVNVSVSDSHKTSYTNSTLTANNTNIKTKGDLNLQGNIESNNITLDIGKDLNIASMVDKSSAKSLDLASNGEVALGVANNTIVAGDISGNLGVGYKDSSSNLVKRQSGIIAKNSINGNIGNNINLKGAVIGSQSGNGNLNVKGTINSQAINLSQKEDGASVNIAGGTNKAFGAGINLNDHIAKDGSLSSGINIKINGSDSPINKEITNTTNMTDNSWAGGNMSFSGSKSFFNNLKNKSTNLNVETNVGRFHTRTGSYDF